MAKIFLPIDLPPSFVSPSVFYLLGRSAFPRRLAETTLPQGLLSHLDFIWRFARAAFLTFSSQTAISPLLRSLSLSLSLSTAESFSFCFY